MHMVFMNWQKNHNNLDDIPLVHNHQGFGQRNGRLLMNEDLAAAVGVERLDQTDGVQL